MKSREFLRCYCCGTEYQRGSFQCCKPTRNTPSNVWLGRYCAVCKHCPKHCTCDTITPRVATVRPLAELAQQAAASLLPPAERLRHLSVDHAPADVARPEWTQWTPYRESE